MHECNAMQILETKEKKHKNQRAMVTKDKVMKHKDQEIRKFRDTESHQLLDEWFQTYFYQEVW